MNSLKKIGILFSSVVLVAACSSAESDAPSYKPSSGGSGPSSASDDAHEGAQSGGDKDADEASNGTSEASESPEDVLAGMTETDSLRYTANGNHQGAGTHFRTADGAINCLVNAMNQFCFFEQTSDPSTLDGAEDILCETSRGGQPHSADTYIGWNPSNGMGDPGTKPGLCQLDGGFPWRGGASAELPSGEKLSILIDLETHDTVECGNDNETIICVYQGHGFTASANEVSAW